MLTQEQVDDIEYKAVEDYMDEIRNRPNTYYSDEELRGDIQHWTDADDYYTVYASKNTCPSLLLIYSSFVPKNTP